MSQDPQLTKWSPPRVNVYTPVIVQRSERIKNVNDINFSLSRHLQSEDMFVPALRQSENDSKLFLTLIFILSRPSRD